MIYYFISYIWSRYVRYSDQSECKFKWNYGEELSQTHPIEWLVDIRNKYTTVEESGKDVMYEYRLLGWNEIPEEIYNRYNGEIG